MPLVWRGMGILVPIIFVISGSLVAWLGGDTDHSLGNGSFMGWTALWAGIVTLLVGLAARATSAQDDGSGNTYRKKHDFFWIPIYIWGIFFTVLSLYLLIFSGKSSTPSPSPSQGLENPLPPDTETGEEPVERKVHFYNPTKDTMDFVISDFTDEGEIDRGLVPPFSHISRKLEPGDYYFSGHDNKEEWTLQLPYKEYKTDTTKYLRYTDEDGPYYQRIVGAPTPETDDYDDACFSLDGKTDLLLVNVTEACNPDYTKSKMKEGDWTNAIQEELDAHDMMEPLYFKFMKGKNIRVLGPGAKIPTKIKENDRVHLLVPYHGEKDKDKVINAAVEKARFGAD